MCPRLKPCFYSEKQYIYMENESVSYIFFVIQGKIVHVLPRFFATPYISINEGNQFGVIDIVASIELGNINLDDWFSKKSQLKRMFSAQSMTVCETLNLDLHNLYHMQQEFNEDFMELYEYTKTRLKRCLETKLQAIEKCT